MLERDNISHEILSDTFDDLRISQPSMILNKIEWNATLNRLMLNTSLYLFTVQSEKVISTNNNLITVFRDLGDDSSFS